MASATAIWNQAGAGVNPPANAKPMAGPSGTNGTAAAGASTISANDFLTLLVTEMKNQDPTANTDPNEYINQLVQVNSLEQLIDINQNLSTALGATSTPSGNPKTNRGPEPVKQGQATPAATAGADSGAHASAAQSSSQTGSVVPTESHLVRAHSIPGNLSIPNVSTSAQRVANALSGHK